VQLQEWYWLILVIWAIFYGYGNWTDSPNGRYGRIGSGLVLLILLAIIGFKTMGNVVKN
jgi:hypothetical protein